MRRSWLKAKSAAVAGVTVTLALLVNFVASDAFAGAVRGRVSGHDKIVPEVYAEAARPDSHRATWREPSPTVRAEFRVLSANAPREICIAALGPAAAPPREPLTLRIAGGRTVPTNVVVAPGTRIVFENRDPFPHRVFAVGVATWGAETINAGSKREWTAPIGQGRFEFRDELTPSLRLYVMVEPQVISVAYPNRDGTFALTLPSGEATLQAFFNGKRIGRPVTVTAVDGRAVDLREAMALTEGAESK